MRRSVPLTLAMGAAGLALLLGLGVWQVQRLGWKRDLLAAIEARIDDAPWPLPAAPDPVQDRYLPVAITGRLAGPGVRVLTSRNLAGAGHRLVAAFETDAGRRILLDRGFVSVRDTLPPPPDGPLAVTGNLQWPDETDRFTPAPDGDLWFARDVAALAAALGTEPVLVVARSATPPSPPIAPMPVDTAAIPNNHLGYAITWFSLAAIWAGMTAALVRRIRRGT